MQRLDRIEKRRFVGREFLLWLWFETEIRDATLKTKEHGEFGMWIEKNMSLGAGKTETTKIKGMTPHAGREAKEALLRGKLPESCAFRISVGEEESSFTLKADKLALAGLKLPTVLDKDDDAGPVSLAEVAGARRGPPRKKKGDLSQEAVDREAGQAIEAAQMAFTDRMGRTRDVEAILVALYRDFLALRLGDGWRSAVFPAMARWVKGAEVDVDAYDRVRRESAARAERPSRPQAVPQPLPQPLPRAPKAPARKSA